MPFKVRRLQGEQQLLINPKDVPKGHVLTNPCVAGDIVYMRDIYQKTSPPAGNVNNIVLYDKSKFMTINVETPWHMLQPTQGYYTGLEDLRIISYKDTLYFTATTTHASHRMQSEIVFGNFTKDLKQIEKLSYLEMGAPPVKNVCPFVHNDSIHLLDMHTHTIYLVKYEDVNDAKKEEKTTHNTCTEAYYTTEKKISLQPPDSGYVFGSKTTRGSTSPIHLHGTTWGCVVHDVIYDDNTLLQTKSKLAYLHQWVEFDIAAGCVTFVSSPFFIAKFGIEFVSGIEKQGAKIHMYMGIDDKCAAIVITDMHALRA